MAEKTGFFQRLKNGLKKTRENFVAGFDVLFESMHAVDDEFYEELEETLICGDMGVRTTDRLLTDLKERMEREGLYTARECRGALVECIRDIMQVDSTGYAFLERKSVVLVVGVNGVGKTTTIGKLAAQWKAAGKKVILAAADTFRAAAMEQLKEWANRAGVEMIGGAEGQDPGSVVYDACQAAKARNADILLVDTAGRLHNKKNLMAELSKLDRILTREFPDTARETLVVLDATTGQNALEQARQFSEAASLTGIILTKMDGTAKGGIAVAIQSELKIPVKYIGVGEKIEDLERFDPNEFVDALFEK